MILVDPQSEFGEHVSWSNNLPSHWLSASSGCFDGKTKGLSTASHFQVRRQAQKTNSNFSVSLALEKWSNMRKRRTDGLDAGKGVRLKRLLDKLAVGKSIFTDLRQSLTHTNGRSYQAPSSFIRPFPPQSFHLNCQLPPGCVSIETVSFYLCSNISDTNEICRQWGCPWQQRSVHPHIR